MSWWTVAWIIWIASFFAIEIPALLNKQRMDTASEHWWSLFRVRQRVPLWIRVPLLAVQLTFGVWLVGHLALGWWTL